MWPPGESPVQAAEFCVRVVEFCVEAAEFCVGGAEFPVQAAEFCVGGAEFPVQAAEFCAQVADIRARVGESPLGPRDSSLARVDMNLARLGADANTAAELAWSRISRARLRDSVARPQISPV